LWFPDLDTIPFLVEWYNLEIPNNFNERRLYHENSGQTFLKAASMAIHLALEPQMIPLAYCNPTLIMAGWRQP